MDGGDLQSAASTTPHGVGVSLMDEVAQITGDRWACLILRSIFSGLRRFEEIYRDTAMATNILLERLAWLTSMGVIKADHYSETSQRVEYRLTEKGIDYYPILLMLLRWGDQYYVSPEGPPLVLRHKGKGGGHELLPAVTCSCCGGVVRPQDVTYQVVVARAKPARSLRSAS